MARQSFDRVLSDEEMSVQLKRSEVFFINSPEWQDIERQIDRLGFEEQFFVTQVSARGGKVTKVAPVGQQQGQEAA